jgi:5-methylcytosine-specific restriction endonuclease McrA
MVVKEFDGLPRTHFGFHWDHLESRYNGGSDDWLNLVPSCPSCNHSKQHKALPLWLLRRNDPKLIAARQKRDARAAVCELAAEQDLEALLRASLRVA